MTLTVPACPRKRLKPPGSEGNVELQDEPDLGSGPASHLQLLRVLGEAPGHEGRRDGIPMGRKEGRRSRRRDGIPGTRLAPHRPRCHLATGKQ